MTIEEAWAAVKEVAGDDVRITVNERDTTVEAYAKTGMEALGYGYGKTPEEALTALKATIERNKAGATNGG